MYTGSYEPLRGAEVSAAYDSVMRISLRREGRAAHPPDAPLGGAGLRRRDRLAPGPGLLHRRVPPAPRDQLGHRHDCCSSSRWRPASPATRSPTTCCRAPGCASPTRSSSPSRSSASALSYLLFGGEWPGTDIIARLYPVHILLIPGLIIALLSVHLALVWRQKHTQFAGPARTKGNVVGERVWPAFAMKSIGLLFLTAAVITALGAHLRHQRRSGCTGRTTPPPPPRIRSPTGTSGSSRARCACSRRGRRASAGS